MLPRSFQNPNGFNIDFSARRTMINFIKRTAPLFGYYVLRIDPIYQNTLINVRSLFARVKNLVVRARKNDRKGVAKEYANLAAQIGVFFSTDDILGTVPDFVSPSQTMTTITLTWGAVPNATNYIIQRSSSAAFLPGTIDDLYSGPLLTYTNIGLALSTVWHYRVKAQAVGYRDSLFSTLQAETTAV